MTEQALIISEACKKRFLPVVKKIESVLEKDNDIPILVAIDGMCASGKTTLGYYLKEYFNCNLFHMDDFFLQNYQRTEERLCEVGGNVDYERFKTEVITPLLERKSVMYRPFRCNIRQILDGQKVEFKRLNIIEGSYSQHPYFDDIYSLKVFTKIPYEKQIERIRVRNGEKMLEKFISEWIPKENAYFEKYNIEENNMVILN
ncbi:MAG: hypothetical protein Q4F66_00940 [Clostridium sp.]|nr:hypothetical protein [Clostridium sp.]